MIHLMAAVSVGCAGWSIPRQEQPHFPAEGSHLERYASRLPVVEINSSFYRPHRTTTYERWANAVPAHFRFAVKMPKAITHVGKLAGSKELLDAFLNEVNGLGPKLGVLLVQLPPSLEFERSLAECFFTALREQHPGPVACEPRHPSWFEPPAGELLSRMRVARVAADPSPVPTAALPGGWDGLAYHRFHGSPRMYYSAYSDELLARLAGQLVEQSASGADVWCVFDNTAAGFAMTNALSLHERITESRLPNKRRTS